MHHQHLDLAGAERLQQCLERTEAIAMVEIGAERTVCPTLPAA
jgi:hypothetical protein